MRGNKNALFSNYMVVLKRTQVTELSHRGWAGPHSL